MYLDRIAPYIDTDAGKVVTGIWRSGKSVLMQQIEDDLLEAGPLPKPDCQHELRSDGKGVAPES